MIMDALSSDDIRLIDNYRECYAYREDGSRDGEFADTPYILREWAKCKREYLFKMFGEQLILTRHIEYEKSEDEMADEFHDLVSRNGFGRKERCGGIFYDALFDFVYQYENGEYILPMSIRDNLMRLMNFNSLSKNKYDGETFIITLPNGKDFKIQHGCKVSRVLGKIAEAFNLPGYEDFRICHSQILNQKTLSGNLCISIHPLDYMTMSDNECDWDSCMSWRNEGCYRQGTVEMMNSRGVIVAYLTADNPMKMYEPHFYNGSDVWSNKKWRELFVVDERVIASVKGYPYHNGDLSLIVMNWLRELAATNLNWTYKDPIKWDSSDSISINKVSPFTIEINHENMYNDFGSAPFHWLSFIKDFNDNDLTKYTFANYFNLQYSGRPECMVCGFLDASFESEGDLACNDCQTRVYCECCEEVIPDHVYTVDGMKLCEYCFDNRTYNCDCCNEAHFTDNMLEVYVIPRFNEEDNKRLRENYLKADLMPFIHGGVTLEHCDDMMYRLNYPEIRLCANDDCLNNWSKNNLIEGHRPHYRKIGYSVKCYVYYDELTEDAQDTYVYGYGNDPERFKESFGNQIAYPSKFITDI